MLNISTSYQHEKKLNAVKFATEIFAKQVSQLYSVLTLALIAATVNALLLVFVLWTVIPHDVLLIWLVLIVVINIVRSLSAQKYKSIYPSDTAAHKWYLFFLIGSTISAFLWGSVSILLFPENDLVHQVFLAFVLGGIAAGAITSLSFTKTTIYSYLLLVLVPLIIRFYISDIELGRTMGFLLTLYLIMLLVSAKRTYILNELSVSLQFESKDQKNALQKNEDRYKILLDTASDAFYFSDLDGHMLDVNTHACKNLGYSHDELLQMSVSDIDIGPNPEIITPLWPQLEKGEVIQIESIHRRKDGTTFPVEVNVGLIQINNIKYFSVLARDITERKRIDKLKNEFISTVSHELRTPLTSIRGALGLINGGALGELPVKVMEILKIAGNNTERLLLLINDILDIQKYESGQFELSKNPIKVMPLIKQSIQENAAYGDAYKVKYVITNELENVIIDADKNRLMQVMANLLSNAAKFSHENQNVEISTSAIDDGFIRISIKDYGYGIPKDFKPKIFARFTQFDSSDTRSKGGTGLGLSISKLIIEKHGGRIDFTSEEGKGTTFYIDIPRLS